MEEGKIVRVVRDQDATLTGGNAKHIVIPDATQSRERYDAQDIMAGVCKQPGYISGYVFIQTQARHAAQPA